jgi:hypothetical protein
MRFLVPGLAALAIVLGFAGCGENGDGGEGSGFADRADAVCSKYEARISRIPLADASDPQQLAIFLERANPVARQQNAELRKLPGANEPKARELLGALDAEVRASEKLRKAARRQDQTAARAALAEAGVATQRSKRAAEALDLLVCGAS